MLLDQLGGALQGTRSCALAVDIGADRVGMTIGGAPTLLSDESLVVARFLFEREDCELAITDAGVTVQLPTIARSVADKP